MNATPGGPALAERIDAVVIGTSAGGIEALAVLLPALPANGRAAVFVVIHLPRERPSLLVEIFRPMCRAEVREADDKMPVEAGVVYFAPPDYHLLIDDGPRLALSADEPVNYSRPAIDVLFESAADIYGARLMGIVLTGANRDGAAGLAAVKAAGGYAVIQTPASAQAALMPESAGRRVAADFTGTPAEIAALLGTLFAQDKEKAPAAGASSSGAAAPRRQGRFSARNRDGTG
jgi:two-component system chemotaxis response regulator CheB